MTLKQARFRYRLSLIGMPILVLSILLTRYGTWNVYAHLVGVTGIAAIGVALVWWGMRYGDMLDAHAAAAKKRALP